MSTRMNEADWELALEVFRACLPARGAKAKNDRLFLEALHHFTVHNITWRALPERFGNWNSVWKRFDRLGKASVFEDYFAMLAGLSGTAHLVQMFDSTDNGAYFGRNFVRNFRNRCEEFFFDLDILRTRFTEYDVKYNWLRRYGGQLFYLRGKLPLEVPQWLVRRKLLHFDLIVFVFYGNEEVRGRASRARRGFESNQEPSLMQFCRKT